MKMEKKKLKRKFLQEDATLVKVLRVVGFFK
jgi:hypothetical protein